MMEMNPDYDYWFFSDDDRDYFMNQIMANEFDGKLFRAYNLLSDSNGAAKSDLWRYAVLWKYGGIYFDFDAVCFVPMDEIIHSANASFVLSSCDSKIYELMKHHLKSYGESKEVMLEWLADDDRDHRIKPIQWAFMSAPKHPMLTTTIKTIAGRILDEKYQNKMKLHDPKQDIEQLTRKVTGPSAFGVAVNRAVIREELVMGKDYAIYGFVWKGLCELICCFTHFDFVLFLLIESWM